MNITTSESANFLRAAMPRGSTVYTILRSASRSGTSRVIGVVTIQPGLGHDGEALIRHPNYHVANLLGLKDVPAQDGIRISGGGMDMGFDLVDSLSRKLYGEAGALNQRWL